VCPSSALKVSKNEEPSVITVSEMRRIVYREVEEKPAITLNLVIVLESHFLKLLSSQLPQSAFYCFNIMAISVTVEKHLEDLFEMFMVNSRKM